MRSAHKILKGLSDRCRQKFNIMQMPESENSHELHSLIIASRWISFQISTIYILLYINWVGNLSWKPSLKTKTLSLWTLFMFFWNNLIEDVVLCRKCRIWKWNVSDSKINLSKSKLLNLPQTVYFLKMIKKILKKFPKML